MHIIKSVGVLSVAKIMGLIQACFGLAFAPFFLLIGLLGSLTGQEKIRSLESSECFWRCSCRCSTGRWGL